MDAGPPDGDAVILLHGWPYDIHSFADVVPLLTAAGQRVVVPYLRGYGTTRFLSDDTMRDGEPAAMGLDLIALMDALNIDTAKLAGFDWGARTADVVAALWPERCRGLVSVSGYLIDGQKSGTVPLPPKAEFAWWYQYYFATERGREGYDKNRRDFAKLIWRTASPRWTFDDATFDRSAVAFDNPDHVAIVIHNYRWRLALADGEPQYEEPSGHRGVGRSTRTGSPRTSPSWMRHRAVVTARRAASLPCSMRWRSRSRAIRRLRLNCRSSSTTTTRPDGRCVARTAVLALFRC